MNRIVKKKNLLASTSSFIEKLTKMLDNHQYVNIIAWTQDEQAIAIKSVTQLTEIVLPIYFKHRNFSSFIRQLNMYNFNKIRHQEGDHVYMNQLFKKNNKKEYKNIKRRTTQQREQIVAYQSVNNYKGNVPLLMKELGELNKKQRELEIVIKHLITDNQKLRNQNSKLWKKIQKTMNRSDKKLQKLLWFLLFGTQNGIQNNPALKEINRQVSENCESECQLKDQSDNQDQRNTHFINPNIMNKVLDMLDSKNGVSNIKNLIKCLFQEKSKPKKKKQNFTIVQKPQQTEQNLCIKQNGESDNVAGFQQLKQQQVSIISDVNLFLNMNDGLGEEIPLITDN